MAGYGKATREKKLREAYRFGRILLKGSKGKPFKGFAGAIQKGVYNPDYLLTVDWEKIAELSEDAFVEYAEAAKAYKDENGSCIKATEDMPQGFEPTQYQEPVQASIDFEKADVLERIATALEKIAKAFDDAMDGGICDNHYFHVRTCNE